MDEGYNCVVVLGPTASGKTRLACVIAARLNGEVISADSRQVYKGLDIGTGKDLSEYSANGQKVPFHLIDIAEPGTQFFLHDFIRECDQAFTDISTRGKLPVICGGTGLYLDALRKNFEFTQVPEDDDFRESAKALSKEQLLEVLKTFPREYYAHADLNSQKRIIRAIEVARYQSISRVASPQRPHYRPFYIGIRTEPSERGQLIRSRLKSRLHEGLIEEAESLLSTRLSHAQLRFLGLEYRFLSMYLSGEIDLKRLEEGLCAAILQYAKRQMTWFRKMEREGVAIHWINREQHTDALIACLTERFSY